MAGIQASHAPRLAAMLRRLNETTNAQGMNLPGWGLHPLKGRELKGHFSVWVNGNWRMTFHLMAPTLCWRTIRITTEQEIF